MSSVTEPAAPRKRPTPAERPGGNGAGQPRAKPKRMSKRSLMFAAGAAAVVSFALPWATIRALPKSLAPVDRQVIVVPPGGQIIVNSGPTAPGTGVTAATKTSAPAVATTRASAPAPPGV